MSDERTTAPDSAAETPAALHFRVRHRLTHAREFQGTFEAQMKRYRGAITVYTIPNQRPNWRLGLSISGRIGNAVVRNRLKRLIREAFRLEQHALPMRADGTGYDMVVTARGHKQLPLAAYRVLVLDLANDLHRAWERRAKTPPASPPPIERGDGA